MDKEMKRLIYERVMSDTEKESKLLFQTWCDMGELSDGESEELGDGLRNIEAIARKSATIAYSALCAAGDSIKMNEVVDYVDREGLEFDDE